MAELFIDIRASQIYMVQHTKMVVQRDLKYMKFIN